MEKINALPKTNSLPEVVIPNLLQLSIEQQKLKIDAETNTYQVVNEDSKLVIFTRPNESVEVPICLVSVSGSFPDTSFQLANGYEVFQLVNRRNKEFDLKIKFVNRSNDFEQLKVLIFPFLDSLDNFPIWTVSHKVFELFNVEKIKIQSWSVSEVNNWQLIEFSVKAKEVIDLQLNIEP